MKIQRAAATESKKVIRLHEKLGTLAVAIKGLGLPAPAPNQFHGSNPLPVLFWREYVRAGGLVLDPNLWRLEAGAHAVVAGVIEKALANGWDSSKATADFLYLSGVSGDVMRQDVNYAINRNTSFEDYIGERVLGFMLLSMEAVRDIVCPAW